MPSKYVVCASLQFGWYKPFLTASDKSGYLKANNAVIDGIRDTAACLQNGKIKFNDCCENTFKEFSSYVWDTKHAEKTGEDRPMKIHDHAMDDIRYFVNTVLSHSSRAVYFKH